MRSSEGQPLRLPARAESPRGPVAPARRVDDLDRGIIEALQENGRESFRRIAFSCGQVIMDNQLLLYYGGADSVVCVASYELSELLPKK